jgi:hypothetical protein
MSVILGIASLLLTILIWRRVKLSKYLGMLTSIIGLAYIFLFLFALRKPFTILSDPLMDLVIVLPITFLLVTTIFLWNLSSTRNYFK